MFRHILQQAFVARLSLFICMSFSVLGQMAHANNDISIDEGWQASIAVGSLNLDYAEIDEQGITPNGTFNTETGNLPMVTLELSESHKLNFIAINSHLEDIRKQSLR